MKKYTKYAALCTAVLALAVTGCGSDKSVESTTAKTEETVAPTATPTTDPTTDPATAAADGENTPADEADDMAGVGEGSNMVTEDGTVDISDAKKSEIGKTITCSKDGKDLYTISIDSVTLTNDRNNYDSVQPDYVAKVTYTYKNIAAESLLIDNFSFLLVDEDGSACEPYALVDKDETMPLAVGESITRTIAYSLNTSGKNVKLFYNATTADNSIYEFSATLAEEK